MENKHLRSMTTIAAVVLAALLLALVGTKPADAAFPGLNGRITYRSGEDIWTMNANGSDRMNLTPGPNGEGDTPAYSPDGTKIAFTRDGALWTMNSDGTDQRRLSETGGIGWAPDWSPDGMELVFARTRFGDLAVIEANGTGETRLTTGDAAFDDVPAYSPDGRYIVYSNCTRDGSPGGASS